MKTKISVLLLATLLAVFGLASPASARTILASYSSNCSSSQLETHGSVSLGVSTQTRSVNGAVSGGQMVKWAAPQKVRVFIRARGHVVMSTTAAHGSFKRPIKGRRDCIGSVRISSVS